MSRKAKVQNAIIIGGDTYELVDIGADADDCGTCDLRDICNGRECICIDIFGFEESNRKHFKKT